LWTASQTCGDILARMSKPLFADEWRSDLGRRGQKNSRPVWRLAAFDDVGLVRGSRRVRAAQIVLPSIGGRLDFLA